MPLGPSNVALAIAALMSKAVPKTEATSGAAGGSGLIPDADHQHPRLTSTHTGTLNASAEDTITFTRTFSEKPSWSDSWEEVADNGAVVIKVKSWVQDVNGNYTGCVIKGLRSQTIPQNLVTVLVSAVFNVFGGSASGVNYSMIFIKKS